MYRAVMTHQVKSRTHRHVQTATMALQLTESINT